MSFYIKTYSSLIDKIFKNNKIFLDSKGKIDINLILKEPNLEMINEFNQIEKFLFFNFYKNKYKKQWKKLLKEIRKNKKSISIIKYIIKLVDNLLKNLQLNKTSELIKINLSNEQIGGVFELTRPKVIFGATFTISLFTLPISLSNSLFIALGVTAYDFINSPISDQIQDDARFARELGEEDQRNFNREQQIRRDEAMARRLQGQRGQQGQQRQQRQQERQARQARQAQRQFVARDRQLNFRNLDINQRMQRQFIDRYYHYFNTIRNEFFTTEYYGGTNENSILSNIFNLKIIIHSNEAQLENRQRRFSPNYVAHLLHTGGHFLVILPDSLSRQTEHATAITNLGILNENNRELHNEIIRDILSLGRDRDNYWNRQFFREDGQSELMPAYDENIIGPIPRGFITGDNRFGQFAQIPYPRSGQLLNVYGDGACYFRAIITAIRFNLTGDILGFNPPGILEIVYKIKQLIFNEINYFRQNRH